LVQFFKTLALKSGAAADQRVKSSAYVDQYKAWHAGIRGTALIPVWLQRSFFFSGGYICGSMASANGEYSY
jgi:hypothetical protein